MNRGPDLILTLVLLAALAALGAAGFVASRPRPPRRRLSDAELRRRFPTIHDRLRGHDQWIRP
jgi:hypothetical protein